MSYEEIHRRYRFARKKWGIARVSQTDVAMFRFGETYNPAVELVLPTTATLPGATVPTQNLVKMPPDFGEVVRILCLNNRTVRFIPGDAESFHWIDNEQGSYDRSSNVLLLDQPDGLTFFYDIVDLRQLYITPVVSGTFTLQLDYITIKSQLTYSVIGTVQQGGTTLTGTGTQWLQDGVFAEESLAGAELVVLPQSTPITLAQALANGTATAAQVSQGLSQVNMNKQYPKVTALISDTQAQMALPATLAAGTVALMVSVPRLPVDTHRWIAEYASTLMLKKINPELSEKYGADVLTRFDNSIRPEASRRQGQSSTITEDAEEFGVGGVI